MASLVRDLLIDAIARRGYRVIYVSGDAAQAVRQGYHGEQRIGAGQVWALTEFASRRVWVWEGLDGLDLLNTLAHELGHICMHAPPAKPPPQVQMEIEAELFACSLLRAMGVDIADLSRRYLVGHVLKDEHIDTYTYKRYVENVQKVCREIFGDVDAPLDL